MKFGIYAIRDVYTGFLSPTVEVNDLVAKRNFEHACNRSDSLLFSHAQDYDLYKIVEFESDSGVVTPLTPIEFIANGKSVLGGSVDA